MRKNRLMGEINPGNEIQQSKYTFIAIDTDIPEEAVREILFRLDAGYKGLTVRKIIQK
jgi:hypothetical protein